MTTNFFPSNLQWFGLAKETTYGTPIAAPTIWVPITSPKFGADINPLTDQAMRGLMGTDFQQVAGMRNDEVSYTTYLYMDSIYQHFLNWFGGTDTVTGSSDPYTHKVSLYNGSGSNGAQPTSFTGFYIDAAGHCFQIPGMQLASLKLDVKVDELISLDVSWQGLPSTPIAIPTSTPTALKPMPSWNSTISIGGSASSQYSEVALTYTRDTKPIPTINASQSPLAIYAGAVNVTGDLTAVYQGTTDVNWVDYLANTQPVLTVKMAPVGDAVHSLTLQHSVTAFDMSAITPGDDWMEIDATVKCLMNTTDSTSSTQSPGQAIFLSAQTTAY